MHNYLTLNNGILESNDFVLTSVNYKLLKVKFLV